MFFMHPYFDVFVAEQVVELKLFPPYDKPAFTVSSREGLPEVHGKLVDSHIRELAIAERYLHFFRGQHRRLLRLVQGLRDGGQDVRMSLTAFRSEEHTSELQSLMRISYAVFCLKKKKTTTTDHENT